MKSELYRVWSTIYIKDRMILYILTHSGLVQLILEGTVETAVREIEKRQLAWYGNGQRLDPPRWPKITIK